MKQYLNLQKDILANGVETGDRTGTGTITMPGYQYTVKLNKTDDGIIHGFPLLTTKFVSLKSVVEELQWKLRGDTNIRFLIQHDNHIWTEWPFKYYLEKTGQQSLIDNMWADDEKNDYSDEWKVAKKEFEQKILNDDEFNAVWGGLGRTYGHQFRNFGSTMFRDLDSDKQEELKGKYKMDEAFIKGEDQLKNAINLIKNNPENRRIIISLWNPKDANKTLLPPCPCFYQFFANQKGMLHLQMYQRSCDTLLGVPYNTAQDSFFLCLMAHITKLSPSMFIHTFGDAHIYLNHIEQSKEQIARIPTELPSIRINPEIKTIDDFLNMEPKDTFELFNYNPQKRIKGAVSI